MDTVIGTVFLVPEACVCDNSFWLIYFKHVLFCPRSMDGADLCFEIVNRVHAGFVYSEAVARWVLIFWFYP